MGEESINANGNNLAISGGNPAPVPAPLPPRSQNQNDSILEIVWRQRSAVGVTVAVCVVLAILYLLIATRYYSGYASLYVQQASSNGLNAQEVRPSQDPETFIFAQREVISSTPVIAMALATPGIRDLKTFDGEDNLFQFLKKNLSVEVGKKDQSLGVQFDAPYREDAQKVVQAVVDSYKNYQSKQRHSSTADALEVLTAQKTKRDAELKAKQDELTKFRSTHNLISGADEKSNVIKQRLETLTKQLTDAQVETINAKSAWDDVSNTILADPERKKLFESARSNSGYLAPTAIDDATLRSEMMKAEEQLRLLSAHYLPNHPAIRRAKATIDGFNINYANAVYRRYQKAEQTEKSLQKAFDEQQTVAVANNSTAVTDNRLAADVTRLQQLTDDLDKQIKNLDIVSAGGAPSIQVLEPAAVSRTPSSPRFGRTLALAVFGGLMLGCGFACVRDWYDYRLRSADEVKSSLGITVLGLIPHVDDENSPISRGQKIHIDPQSPVAEAYRSLRTAVYFGTKEQQARTILVTSPERGDGKTTMASNLAISIAQAGRRVLLVDADMRAPMQDLIFGINGRQGLATVLSGKEPADNVIRHTGIENLDLLPAGVAARNPSELLNSAKFIELLDELSEKYDQVIIDSPPLLAVTDARIVAASTDATILVLRAGKSNRKLSELSVDGLVSVGAKLLGAVVNDIRRRTYKNYGSYGTYGRYGYGNDGNSEDRSSVTPSAVMTDDDANYAAGERQGALARRDRMN